jgi:hypothetical protein
LLRLDAIVETSGLNNIQSVPGCTFDFLRAFLMRTQLLLLAAIFSSSFVAIAFTADEEVIKVSPVGVPTDLAKGNTIRYFVWHDAAGWHLRTDSNDKAHDFTGVIDVVGGKFTAVTDFENLESGRKKGRSDTGILNKAKTQVTFKFTTSKRRDGFDFQVDEDAKQIRFKLMIDGKPTPKRVLLGAASSPAPADIFLLPAKPE